MITRRKLIIKDKVVNFIVRINILKSLSVKPCAANGVLLGGIVLFCPRLLM